MPVTVLLLAANPLDTTRLQLDEELRHITRSIRTAEHRDAIRIVPWLAARPDDLVQGLLEHRPQVVHFSGHGTATEKICFVGDDGRTRPVGSEVLHRVFGILRDDIRVVLLNACYSADQAAVFAQHIDFTIGMSRAVADRAAIAFAGSFYRALGFGRSVQEAFDLAVTTLLLDDIPGEDIPRLVTRPGAPAPAYLLTAPTTATTSPRLPVIVSSRSAPSDHPRYLTTRTDDRVVIDARDPFLDTVRQDGDVPTVPSMRPWQSAFTWPMIDVKVVNNTGETVYVHDAVFRVAASCPDPRPVPLIHARGRPMTLPLVNVGWGPMTDCVLRFQFSPGWKSQPVTAWFEWRCDEWPAAGLGISLAPFLAQAGVDVEALQRMDLSTEHPTRERERAAIGPFERASAVLTGVLEYTQAEADGGRTRRSQRVGTLVFFRPLSDRYDTGSGPPARYNGPLLRSDGRDYDVSVPVSKTLAPGETDQFLLQIAAERSSRHDFTLLLRYNGGAQAASEPVRLELFVARPDAERMFQPSTI